MEIDRKKVHEQMMGDWVSHLDSAIQIAENEIYPNLTRLKDKVTMYPEGNKIYRAFKECQYNNLKVVLLGQDPYHNPKSATGLCFQVGSGRLNPSVKNIMKKLDINQQPDFDSWAKQGVLLLNTALTVEKGKAGSHTNMWKNFTEEVIKTINEKDDIVWILWGAHALSYRKFITNKTHKTIISSHPSPFSVMKPLRQYPSFNDSNPFEETNKYLNAPIKWTVNQ